MQLTPFTSTRSMAAFYATLAGLGRGRDQMSHKAQNLQSYPVQKVCQPLVFTKGSSFLKKHATVFPMSSRVALPPRLCPMATGWLSPTG